MTAKGVAPQQYIEEAAKAVSIIKIFLYFSLNLE